MRQGQSLLCATINYFLLPLQEMGQLLGMLGVAFGIGGMGTLKGGLCRKGAVRLSAIFPLAIPRTPNSP